MNLYLFEIDQDLHPKGITGVVFASNKLMAHHQLTSKLRRAGLGTHRAADYTITKIQSPSAFVLYPPK